MSVKNYNTTVIAKDLVAKDTYLLKIAFPAGEQFDFKPGQFVTILVQPNIRRSYSISSSPAHTDYIELIGDTVAGGPGSQFWLNVKPNDNVQFLGPLGIFVYQQSARPAYFFATGTGGAPFMSMVEYALRELKTTKPMKVFHSFKHEDEIFGKEFFENLAAEFPNFAYKLTVTRGTETWQGDKGRVTQYLSQIPEEVDFDAYLCGGQNMIVDVKSQLLSLGAERANIYQEKFY